MAGPEDEDSMTALYGSHVPVSHVCSVAECPGQCPLPVVHGGE